LEFYKIHIHPKSPKIKKLSVHVKSLKCTDNKDAITTSGNNESKDDGEIVDKDILKNEDGEENNERDEKDKEIVEVKEDYILSNDNIIITDIVDFKNRMCFGPSAAPVVPLYTFYAKEMFN